MLYLSKLSWIYTATLLFQTIEFTCNEQLQLTLKETFGYDFIIVPELHHVLVWNISSDQEKITPIKCTDIALQFSSNETYLILSRKNKSDFIIFYWLGGKTSQLHKKRTATYAVLLAQFRNAYSCYISVNVNIARETEFLESEPFKHSLKMFNRLTEPHNLNDGYINYVNRNLPSPCPNLYVVRGNEHSRFKKIPISLGVSWLTKNDTCLILEVGFGVKNMRAVDFYCGTEASKKLNERATRVTCRFYDDLIFHTSEWAHKILPNIDQKDIHTLKRFLEVLEDMKFYKTNEVDNSDDYLKNAEDFVNGCGGPLLFDVTIDNLNENLTRPLRYSLFQRESMGYLLDTKSIGGVFLVLGNLRNIKNREVAIQLAEEYMDKNYPLSTEQVMHMRIVEAPPFYQVRDFKLNLSDYPPLHLDVPDDELW